ncbi:hypothetical protein FQN52_009239 [Onygenales sp. PD_12]|nr:hypothetical protein FQN52_009239 [Onygenales sp. PD_12]
MVSGEGDERRLFEQLILLLQLPTTRHHRNIPERFKYIKPKESKSKMEPPPEKRKAETDHPESSTHETKRPCQDLNDEVVSTDNGPMEASATVNSTETTPSELTSSDEQALDPILSSDPPEFPASLLLPDEPPAELINGYNNSCPASESPAQPASSLQLPRTELLWDCCGNCVYRMVKNPRRTRCKPSSRTGKCQQCQRAKVSCTKAPKHLLFQVRVLQRIVQDITYTPKGDRETLKALRHVLALEFNNYLCAPKDIPKSPEPFSETTPAGIPMAKGNELDLAKNPIIAGVSKGKGVTKHSDFLDEKPRVKTKTEVTTQKPQSIQPLMAGGDRASTQDSAIARLPASCGQKNGSVSKIPTPAPANMGDIVSGTSHKNPQSANGVTNDGGTAKTAKTSTPVEGEQGTSGSTDLSHGQGQTVTHTFSGEVLALLGRIADALEDGHK